MPFKRSPTPVSETWKPVETARRCRNPQAYRGIVARMRNRIDTYGRMVRWPALEQSLRRDLDEILRIAAERGWSV